MKRTRGQGAPARHRPNPTDVIKLTAIGERLARAPRGSIELTGGGALSSSERAIAARDRQAWEGKL